MCRTPRVGINLNESPALNESAALNERGGAEQACTARKGQFCLRSRTWTAHERTKIDLYTCATAPAVRTTAYFTAAAHHLAARAHKTSHRASPQPDPRTNHTCHVSHYCTEIFTGRPTYSPSAKITSTTANIRCSAVFHPAELTSAPTTVGPMEAIAYPKD